MLSNSVQPPTVEHVYAQWQERKKSSSAATRSLLQERDGHNRDVKEEDSASLTSGDLTSHNHFRSSRAARLKGNAAGIEKSVSCWCTVRHLTFLFGMKATEGDHRRPTSTLVGPRMMRGSVHCAKNMETVNRTWALNSTTLFAKVQTGHCAIFPTCDNIVLGSGQAAVPWPKWVGARQLLSLVSRGLRRGQRLPAARPQCCH